MKAKTADVIVKIADDLTFDFKHLPYTVNHFSTNLKHEDWICVFSKLKEM